MPHILSSNALDLLFNLELAGRAIPIHEVLFDGAVLPTSGVIITRKAEVVGPNNGVSRNPVLFLALLKLTQDPLLGTVEYKYNFLSPFGVMDNTITGRTASTVIPTFFLPMTAFTINLTALSGISAGVTLVAIYDVLSNDVAALFGQLGSHEVQDVEAQIQTLVKPQTPGNISVPGPGEGGPVTSFSGSVKSLAGRVTAVSGHVAVTSSPVSTQTANIRDRIRNRTRRM